MKTYYIEMNWFGVTNRAEFSNHQGIDKLEAFFDNIICCHIRAESEEKAIKIVRKNVLRYLEKGTYQENSVFMDL